MHEGKGHTWSGCHNMIVQCWRKTKTWQKQHIRVEIALEMLRVASKTIIIAAVFMDFYFQLTDSEKNIQHNCLLLLACF